MKFLLSTLVWIALAAAPGAPGGGKPLPRVLVFSKTAGYRHASIAAGKLALIELGRENGFVVDTTEDASVFTDEGLKPYSVVVFLSTTGHILDTPRQEAFQRFIEHGKGFVGIHAATDTEYGWPWYGKLVGAYFLQHPRPQQATLYVVDPLHPSTKGLPLRWVRTDEWYDFKVMQPDLHVVLTIDTSTYTGSKNGPYHPMAWYHSYDGGRAFYTELGHTEESYRDPLYLGHLLGAIRYAMGK